MGFGCLAVVVVALILGVVALRGFDEIAGRGPKQVKDGMDRHEGERKPCPSCGESIATAAKKCRFCGIEVR